MDASPIRHERHFGTRTVRCFSQRAHGTWPLLTAAASQRLQKEAIVDGQTRLSYGDLMELAQRTHAFLHAKGIRPGDRIALLMDNSAAFIVLWAGLMRAGAVAVPLNPREPRSAICARLRQCEARAIWFHARHAALVPDGEELPNLAQRWHWNPETPLHAALPLPPRRSIAAQPVEEEAPAVILYTSGSSGAPKGALLTHLNLEHSARHLEQAMQLSDRDRSLLAVPLSHVTGLVGIALALLAVGGTVIVLGEFKARRFIETAGAERMTHTLVVPAIYNLLLRDPLLAEADLSNWRIGGFGGAPMPRATFEALARALPHLNLVNGYGATETCSPATVMPVGGQASRGASIGRPVACAEILVMDDQGREVPCGEAGELWIAGPMVIPGYERNPEADAREFCGRYWRSGDIGRRDADGYFHLLDRRKDVVNRGGYKVFSAEVENVISRIPGVLETALVGVADPVLGEKTCAFIVFEDVPADPRTQVHEACRTSLPDYQLPDFVIADNRPLPRNANGKIDKPALRLAAADRIQATPA